MPMRPVPASCRKGGVLSIPTGWNGNGGGSSEPSATMAFWFLIPNQIFASNTMCVHCDEYVANFRGDRDRNCKVAKSTRSRCARGPPPMPLHAPDPRPPLVMEASEVCPCAPSQLHVAKEECYRFRRVGMVTVVDRVNRQPPWLSGS